MLPVDMYVRAGLIDRLACLEERDRTVDNDPALVRVEAMTAFSNLCSKERDDRLINVC